MLNSNFSTECQGLDTDYSRLKFNIRIDTIRDYSLLEAILKIILVFAIRRLFTEVRLVYMPGGGLLAIMAYTGRLRPKGVPFSGFRYIKEYHDLTSLGI